MLLVVNFQDSFGTNKTEAAHASSFQRSLLVFKQSIAQEHSDCREEESATEGPRHGDGVRGWRQVGSARGSLIVRIRRERGQNESRKRHPRQTRPEEAEDRILPPDHLTEDEAHRDEGERDKKEQGVGPLHDGEPLVVTSDLHHGDGAVCHAGPVETANTHAPGNDGTQATHQLVQGVKEPQERRGLGELDHVVSAALGTSHVGAAVPLLLLINPSLDTDLINIESLNTAKNKFKEMFT